MRTGEGSSTVYALLAFAPMDLVAMVKTMSNLLVGPFRHSLARLVSSETSRLVAIGVARICHKSYRGWLVYGNSMDN